MDATRHSSPAAHLIGYARVSTEDQRLDLQLAALTSAGVADADVWSDKSSGVRYDRPGLAGALKECRPGDVLVVWWLDRLARSTAELLRIADDLNRRGVVVRSLTELIDTGGTIGRLVFIVISAMAEFEWNLISEPTKVGIAAARAKGRRGARPARLTDRQFGMAERLMDDSAPTGQQVADQFGVHRGTLYRALADYS